MPSPSIRGRVCVLFALAVLSWGAPAFPQPAPTSFGGSYATLDPRQQQFINDWVTRFTSVTGKKIEAAAFYDEIVRLSTKTTFEAITHALKTTTLSDASGNSLGDALGLIEHVDTVRGKVLSASGDRQFRMYVRLKAGAIDTLMRSREFGRRADNTVYHKGYPINFRGENGVPSIQISISLDQRQADVDVDYRSSSFPAALFNGHLTASNSDVRAGNNFARHTGQWSGLQNWWQSFFGIKLPSNDDAAESEKTDPRTPRIGKKPVDAMMKDFLDAWLIEGDIQAALGYFSPRSLACIADENGGPAADQGMVPLMLARRLKAAHDAVGKHASLNGLVVGVRLTRPTFKTVKQPHGGQFVVYSVPDNEALDFECGDDASQPVDKKAGATPKYGKYFGVTFFIEAPGSPTPVALLWAQDEGYWRIVSWKTDAADTSETPDAPAPSVSAPAHIVADATLVTAANDFFESWLLRKDYAKTMSYLSVDAYACQPVTAGEDAATKLRAAFEQVGKDTGAVRQLDGVVSGVAPVHPLTRIMDHRYSRAFTLTSIPNALATAARCESRARAQKFTGEVTADYGLGYVSAVRFASGGDAPVLRLLWMKHDGAWKITAYDVDLP